MQHQSIAPAAARRLDREGLIGNEPFAASLRRPPLLPPAYSGLSGRPTCRIYPRGKVWILEIDFASGGWLFGDGNADRSLVFPKLAAAIGYAERYGLDYRIEWPRHHQNRNRIRSGRLPRSWLARLAHNGRKGDIYHG